MQQVGVVPKFVTFTSEHVSWYCCDDACGRHGWPVGLDLPAALIVFFTLRVVREATVQWMIGSLTYLRSLNVSVEA